MFFADICTVLVEKLADPDVTQSHNADANWNIVVTLEIGTKWAVRDRRWIGEDLP